MPSAFPPQVSKQSLGLATVVVGVIAVAGVSYYVFGEIALTGFNAIGSVVVSILLAWLYFRQSNIMREQQEFQRELERPVVHVEGYREGDDSDSIEVLLTNSGRSAARELELRVATGFSEQFGDNERYGTFRYARPLERDSAGSDWLRSMGAFLESGNRNVVYQAPHISICWTDPEMSGERKHRIARYDGLEDELTELSNDMIRLVGTLTYEGPSDSYTTKVFDGVIPIAGEGLAKEIEGSVSLGGMREQYVVEPPAQFEE